MSQLFDLTGKVALITGASSGLGVQFAKALAKQGANIVIAARRVEKLEAVKKEIESLGVECLSVRCDVVNNEDIVSMVAEIKERFKKVDILVNNAGIGGFVSATKQTDEHWLNMINLNLNSVYFVTREVGKLMIDQKYGKIINIGSLHSTVAMPGSPITAYNASKGGVAMLTKSLANEWARHNITVNTIAPAYFESEMTEDVIGGEYFDNIVKTYCPMRRVGRPGELDGALLYFASDASSYTTGQLLTVDGGWTTI